MEHFIIGNTNPLRINVDNNIYLSNIKYTTINIGSITAQLKKNILDLDIKSVNETGDEKVLDKININDPWTKFSQEGLVFSRRSIDENVIKVGYEKKIDAIDHYEIQYNANTYKIKYNTTLQIRLFTEVEVRFNIDFDTPTLNAVEYSSTGKKDKYLCMAGTGMIRTDTSEISPMNFMSVSNQISSFYVRITYNDDSLVDIEKMIVFFSYS